LTFSPDGRQLLSGSDDKTARILDVESGRVLHVLDRHENFVWAVAWSPDGTCVATGGHDGKLILWDPVSGQLVREWPIFNFPAGMTFSPDSKLIATPAQRVGVVLYSVEAGEVVQSLMGHSDGLGGIAFSPGGDRVFTSSWDRTVKVWDPISGQETLTLPSADKVNRIALSPDGRNLFGVGDYTTTRWFSPVPPPTTNAQTH
jgi:WD40 repeat protein